MSNHDIKEITVRTSKSYKVFIGRDISNIIADLIPNNVDKIFIITQRKVPDFGIQKLIKSTKIEIPDGEQAKNLKVVEKVCHQLLQASASRKSLIIALGGGVVTDLAGFVAATFMRGIRYINIATTFTAQIDAAIGGKTAVNLATGEKNIIGSFWQPDAVICDLKYLETLKKPQILDGLGELAKYELIAIPGISDMKLIDQVYKCVKYKAEIVAKDEKELTGLRSILNYGHTLAHALEAYAKLHKFKLSHGQAVAVGLCFAGEVAFALNRIDKASLDQHYKVLEKLKLKSKPPFKVNPSQLIRLMTKDKKTSSATVTMILPGEHGFELVSEINPSLLKAILNKLA